MVGVRLVLLCIVCGMDSAGGSAITMHGSHCKQVDTLRCTTDTWETTSCGNLWLTCS